MLTAEGETSIRDQLVYASGRCLGITRQPLGKNVRKLRNDSRSLLWDPPKGPGKAWFNTTFNRNTRRKLRSSQIYEGHRESADHHTRLNVFYYAWQELCDDVQPAATYTWNTDETGNHRFHLAALVSPSLVTAVLA